MNGAMVVLVAGDSGECLNRGRFQNGILDFGRDKNWVVRRDSVAGAKMADGVIVYGVDGRTVSQLERICDQSVAWAQRICPDQSVGVALDEREIGRMGVRHFGESGFQQVGVLMGKGPGESERLEGCRVGAAEWGMEEPAAFPLPDIGKTGLEAVREIAEWLLGFSEPVGVMVPADRWGNDVLYAAEWAELKVPEQVAVLGVGNDEVECGMVPGGLSSIAVGTRRQGELAAAVLDGMMNGRSITGGMREVKPEGVVLRMSSDVRAVPHLKASLALRFIRKNYGEAGLSVDRVASAVGMSRRGLEDAFRNHLQQGIGKTITEMRIRYAKEMLVESRRNVGEVAVLVGFQNSQYFHRCFSKVVGVTPAQFRKREERK